MLALMSEKTGFDNQGQSHYQKCNGDHYNAMVTGWPPTSEDGGSNNRPYMGTVLIAY